MRKYLFLFLLIPFLSQCNDDDNKDALDGELSPEVFYQSIWNGEFICPRGTFPIRLEFPTDSSVIIELPLDIYKSYKPELPYSLENNVLSIKKRKINNILFQSSPVGYWYLIYHNQTWDSIVLKQDIASYFESTLQLKKVPLE